jgi:hypothetical protein
MKKNLRKILPISILVMISVLALSACQSKTTSPITTTSTTSNYEAGNPQPLMFYLFKAHCHRLIPAARMLK